MNLLQRINEVRKDVEYIRKDSSVSTGGTNSYRAVSHDMVTAVTRKSLIQHGIVSFPFLVSSEMLPPLQLDPNKPNKQWLYKAVYDFKFCNVADRSDTETIRVEAHAVDNADKAPGKALSYAKKAATLKLLELETGEDDESRVQEEFDITPHVVAMEAAKTRDELVAAFSAAEKAANGDVPVIKVLAAKRNECGVALARSVPMTDAQFQKAVDAIKAGTFTFERLETERTLTDAQKKTVVDLRSVAK